MNKEMIISSSGHETMAAILEDDEVVELSVERDKSRGVAGNIYKGRVKKVLPGMQCAFVDLGLERDGFLYVSDVIDPVDSLDGIDTSDTDTDGDTDTQTAAGEGPAGGNGSGRGRGRGRGRDRNAAEQKIEKLLTAGQEVMVQVVKEPLGTKGARITSHVTIPGRFLVFMPTVDHIGVSRKIVSREQRVRLRRIVREFRGEHGMPGGVIIRTAAADRPKDDIINDLTYFHELWTETQQKGETRRAPAVIHREDSLVAKLLRDLLTDDFSAIRIDDPGEYEKAVKLVERIMPDLVSRVHHYDKSFPIFEEYGVQSEIDKALRSKVWLKSGGYLVINQTEALVAIDVNTGRYVGKRTGRLEDTIVKTNLEAAKGDRAAGPASRPGWHHRARLYRHGGAQEPPEGVSDVRAGDPTGPVAVESGAGYRVRAHHHHTKAGQAESGAAAYRPVPLLLGQRRREVDLDHLLRDSRRAAQGQRRPRRLSSPVACQPRRRPGP